jgi:hypothetical protein
MSVWLLQYKSKRSPHYIGDHEVSICIKRAQAS